MLICRYFVTCPRPALSKTNDPSKLSAAWSSTGAAVTAPDYPPFMLFVTAIVLAIFVLPSPWKWIVMAVAAVLDLGEYVLYYWWSHRGRVKAGAETLIGATAEVVASCRPDGQVRVQGELWRARCPQGADRGERVRVRKREGLTLLVETEK
ncbi:MAG: hypothetical protein E6G67_02840 [Actinobacteria bacterium]|nr:MAG: hypothetical protein E6G67_02840 [Actinomycetota bacterium]